MIELDDIHDLKVHEYEGIFSVVYQRYEEDDWYDLFEDPSEEICKIIVNVLKNKLDNSSLL